MNVPDDLDREAFQQVWRRVMPEDRVDCPFTLETPEAPARPESQTAPAPVLSPPVQPSFVRPMTSAPASVPTCLGEQSAGDLPALEVMLALAMDGRRIYRALAHRNNGRPRERREGFFSALAEAKQFQVQRLSAAYFLISGQEYTVPPTDFPTSPSLPFAIRERFQAEQQAALHLLAAANSASDPCLTELYRMLAQEDQEHAKKLRDHLVSVQA